jgi:RNA-directed DNA polymerase
MGYQVDWSFDEISHPWLLSHIPMDRTVLRKWLEAGFIDQRIHYPTTTGTPQGGIISPALMNLTLDGLQALLAKQFSKASGKLVHLTRFADGTPVQASNLWGGSPLTLIVRSGV